MNRPPSQAPEAIGLLRTLSKIAAEAREGGWEVNISMETALDADRLHFSAVRIVPGAVRPGTQEEVATLGQINRRFERMLQDFDKGLITPEIDAQFSTPAAPGAASTEED